MTSRHFAILLAALAPIHVLAAECIGAPDVAGGSAESARYTVMFRTIPAPVTVGHAFTLEARVCTKGGAAPPTGLRVDAHMPAHRHGMNYRPTVERVGEGRFRAEGLLFHMPGRWQFVFDIEAPGGRERITRDLQLE